MHANVLFIISVFFSFVVCRVTCSSLKSVSVCVTAAVDDCVSVCVQLSHGDHMPLDAPVERSHGHVLNIHTDASRPSHKERSVHHLSHTHTQAHAHTHTHTHTHTLSLSHSHTHTHTHTHS